jgi:hypothetical protein
MCGSAEFEFAYEANAKSVRLGSKGRRKEKGKPPPEVADLGFVSMETVKTD